MILADTSVWIDHFRHGNDVLIERLEVNGVCVHPFIVGELACGNLQDRWKTLGYFKTLPHVEFIRDEEALHFIDMYKLSSRGLGYIDIHLLACAQLSGVKIWTLDKRLENVAKTLLLNH